MGLENSLNSSGLIPPFFGFVLTKRLAKVPRVARVAQALLGHFPALTSRPALPVPGERGRGYVIKQPRYQIKLFSINCHFSKNNFTDFCCSIILLPSIGLQLKSLIHEIEILCV